MSDTILRVELEVADPELAREKISGDPKMFGVCMRDLLGGREARGDRSNLEQEFGVRVASVLTVFKPTN